MFKLYLLSSYFIGYLKYKIVNLVFRRLLARIGIKGAIGGILAFALAGFAVAMWNKWRKNRR